MDRLMTKKDVCDLLQISQPTLDRLVASGDIPAFKVGGSVRFLSSEVLEYISRCASAARTAPMTEIRGGKPKPRQRQSPRPGERQRYVPGMKVV